jgi:DNA-binding CsgD family transcriptional regulator
MRGEALPGVSRWPATQHSLLNKLTPAEQRVALLLAEGLSNKEISARLGKAEPTIKHQIAAILRATDVPSRARFIARYYQHFLGPLPWATMGPPRLMVAPPMGWRLDHRCGVAASR